MTNEEKQANNEYLAVRKATFRIELDILDAVSALHRANTKGIDLSAHVTNLLDLESSRKRAIRKAKGLE